MMAPLLRATHLKRLGMATAIAFGLIAPLARASHALAIICRSDPILVVNTAAVDVVSTLWTDPAFVREIDYQVTVPSGSLLGKITLTAGLGFPERVTYVFSGAQAWGSVQVAATVVTQDSVSPFPVNVQVSALLTGPNQASGTSDTPTVVGLDHILML